MSDKKTETLKSWLCEAIYGSMESGADVARRDAEDATTAALAKLTPAMRVTLAAELLADIPGAGYRTVTVFMKSLAEMEATAAELGATVSRRLGSDLRIVYEATTSGICLFVSVPATVEDLAALLPAAGKKVSP